LNRIIKFKAEITTTSGSASCNIQLFSTTNSEVVNGTTYSTSSMENFLFDSGPLTVGLSPDFQDESFYEVDIFLTGGGPTDRAIITNARLEISYV
jgi:hypothetical protein